MTRARTSSAFGRTTCSPGLRRSVAGNCWMKAQRRCFAPCTSDEWSLAAPCGKNARKAAKAREVCSPRPNSWVTPPRTPRPHLPFRGPERQRRGGLGVRGGGGVSPRYLRIETSGLTYIVTPGDNFLDLKLEKAPGRH